MKHEEFGRFVDAVVEMTGRSDEYRTHYAHVIVTDRRGHDNQGIVGCSVRKAVESVAADIEAVSDWRRVDEPEITVKDGVLEMTQRIKSPSGNEYIYLVGLTYDMSEVAG